MGTNSYYVLASTVGQAPKIVSKKNFKCSIIEFISGHRWPTKTHLTEATYFLHVLNRVEMHFHKDLALNLRIGKLSCVDRK